MAISHVGAAGALSNNPSSGNFTVHANTQANDIVIAILYSRKSTITFAGTGYGTLSNIIDQNTANGGHISVGWWLASSSADSKSWTMSGGANGDTGGWATSVFRGVDTASPIYASNYAAGGTSQTPDPPAANTESGKPVVIGFGAMDDYGTVTPPTGYTNSATYESTAGNDASVCTAYDLDAGTGSSLNPSAYGTTLTGSAYWYAFTLALKEATAPSYSGLIDPFGRMGMYGM